jgi:hypothetical protein
MGHPRRSSQIASEGHHESHRCTMMVEDHRRCHNRAVHGDILCEKCMRRVELLLESEDFRRVLEWSVKNHPKNGPAGASSTPEKPS